MREIVIGGPKGQPTYEPLSFLVYGASGTGKTHYAASFPRPLFLADATERGWRTINTMNPEVWYEPGVAPAVWGIESAQDMIEAVTRLENELKAQPGKYLTLVVDSVTFYADLYFNDKWRQAGGAQNPKIDMRDLYGKLKQHLYNLRISLQKLPINVVWLALEKQPEVGDAGGPAIPGAAAGTILAGADHVLYARKSRSKEGDVYELHTGGYGPFIARQRDGGLLDAVLNNYTYRDFAKDLGLAAPSLKK